MNLGDINGGKVVFDQISAALVRGEEVRLIGFGSFQVVDKPARPGRDPRSGETIEIAAHRSVKFKPAKTLKAAVA